MPTRLLCALACALLTGCGFSPIVAHEAVDYNRAFADHAETQLLLNIARASRDHPLSFTQLTQVNPTMSANGSLSGSLAFTNASPTDSATYNLGTGMGVSGGTTFEVQPIATQEFYRGLLHRIEFDSFQYFFESGFPKGLIIALLVERVDVARKGGKHCLLVNDPLDADRYAVFNDTIEQLLDQGAYIAAKSVKPGGISAYGLRDTSGVALFEAVRTNGPPATEPCPYLNLKSLAKQGAGSQGVTLRSVEGIFRFLGKVVLAQNQPRPLIATIPDPDPRLRVPILVVRPTAERPELVVGFDGERYAIPSGSEKGHSLLTLNLLLQLFYLSIKSDQLPKASTVLLAN